MLNEQDAINAIKFKLSKKRFQHSLNVAEVARDLAGHYGLDGDLAYLTGILHDYAKGIAAPDLLSIAEANQLMEYETEREVPDLLHAPVGAFLLQQELGLDDKRILQAVRYHTLGSIEMTDLDKIIYLADMIEPGRDYPGMQRLHCLAFRELDEAMLFGIESTIKYCLEAKRILHPRTVEVWNYFLKTVKEVSC
ncbi:MAG: bis(5'-nucleosyl)-tetraphosphatase (symmetrical) YqeK [Syntrophomonadaceae bacterium]|nr:bis(5'-nucleosyl)-tetraphosphatase (symmetrical) YqeK [Syntrophomonadaceae bacterium]MDD3022294.1 bis(5'-nucleosyl)-tetraphosphatase (symmetrical) YqeK [Syntrophomonadaceae bacterium]